MPLLRKQPFHKVKPPPDLRPDDEVFHCTMTNEIFKTYEEFFERTILCNSLVWSCGITGRSGLTYAEAVESERAAEKRLATFDLALQKPLLFLVTLTQKSRFLELCDDIFLFASDRFFIGETVDVIIGRQTMPAVILRVVAPPRTVPSKTNGEVIVIDEDSEPEDEERQLPAAGEMMYVVGLTSNTNKRVMVKAMQISRKKGAYNRDRNKLFLKHKCQSVNGLWCVKETVKQKMLLTGAKFEDFFAGPRPNFAVSEKRKSGAKQPGTGSPTVCTSSSSSPKPTTSSRSSPAASQSLNHSSRPSPTASQSLNHLPRSSPSVSQSQNHLSRPHPAASQTVHHSSRPSAAASQTLNHSYRPSPAASQSMVNHQSSASPGVLGSRQEMMAGAKMQMQKAREQAERNSAQEAMLAAHRQTLRQQERLEKLAKQLAIRKKFEEEKQRMKEEKERARVEKEKERLKKMEEKRIKMQQLREWNRPREDMECDDLKPLPELKELKTRIPVQLFADALMVLEYMNAFKSVFDFEQFFPKGFSWEHIQAAVMESDQQGPLCDLLQMLLCALFNLQEAEAGEVQAEAAEEMLEECEKKAATLNMGDDENGEDDDQISNNELIRSAILSAQFSPLTFGVPLKEMTLDQYTLTEILRLHLMSSGADANQKNARFRYQQRGGYSALDDPGLELRKQESALMKKMQIGNVFDLAPEEKLRLLTTLVQQVMTYAAVRDIVEDSYDKLRVKKYDLKILQWNEARRVREMMGAMYRRDMDEKVKEQEFRMKTIARAAQIKQAIDSGLEPPNLPPVEDPRLTPEQKQQREEEEREQEVKKKEDYAKRDLEVQKEIMELQQINAIYPMGRDRMYRRYWYFSSLPAVLVEDYELFVPSSSVKAGDEVPSVKSHEGDGQVGKVNQENGEGSVESSHTLGDSSKGSSSLTSEGKVDAKQAEQSQEDSKGDSSESKQTGEQSQEQSNGEQTGELSQEQSNSDSSESKQTGEQSQEQKNGDSSESKQTAEQSLEQSNGDLSESGQTEQGSNSGDVTDAKEGEESGEQSRGEVCDTKPTEQSQEQTNGNTTNTNTEQKQTEDTVSDSKPTEQGQTVGDKSDASQSESAQKQPRWYVVDSKPCLQQLMAALNPRGFRENALHNMLQDYQRLLDMTIESCPVDTLCESGSSEENQRERSAGQSTTPTRKVMGSTKGDSASETMELTLRDGLLDMEGRIYAGGLGAIRVKDRAAWRAALENGGYSPLTDEAPFARVHSPKKTKVDTKAARSAYIPEEVVARDLAHAMVQMARGVEPRYLKPPFEHQRRAIYDRWEESALGTTSLSQVFLHLAALDRCIKWNRSTLKLRCRICRRMRDDDKMLLCDKCDRGHHIYCLKPPLTKIPAGDWFCHTCRPKVSAPAPRKRRRNFEEEEEEEESMEFENSVEEASDDEGGERDTDSEEEADDVPNEDICAKCHEDGILILCDVCPRSFHLHCAQPPLKKVPKGKWMCHVCVDGGQRGKNKAKGKQDSARKGSPNTPSSSKKSDKSRLSGSRQQTPRNSPTPSSGRKKQGSSQEVASRGQSQKSKTTPKNQSQSAGSPSKQQTPKSWGNTKGQLKRKSSSMSNLPDADEQESDSSTPEEQMQAAETLLEDLMEHKEAWPFLEPVDKKVAPDYYEVIETPMDLSTIRSKLQQHSYSSAAQLLDDVRLIFTNCIQYNLSSAPVYQAGQALNKYFQSRVRALGLQSSEKSGSSPSKKQRR